MDLQEGKNHIVSLLRYLQIAFLLVWMDGTFSTPPHLGDTIASVARLCFRGRPLVELLETCLYISGISPHCPATHAEALRSSFSSGIKDNLNNGYTEDPPLILLFR